MFSVSARILMAAAALAAMAGCAKKAEEPAADAAAAAPAEAPAGPAIQAVRGRGNEPGWSVDVSEAAIVLTTADGEVRTGAPVLDTVFADGAVLYVATGDKGEVAVKVADQVCTDSMSGMPHPQHVQVWAGGQELKGCGGEPASLLQGGEWTVDELAGKTPVKDSKITLNFGADGSLSGSSSCNRLATSYALTGESLTIKQGAGTMMACEQPVMDQESTFLGLLSAVNGFAIADDGALLLKAADGRTIRARR
jgi:heat shock protein HslJ